MSDQVTSVVVDPEADAREPLIATQVKVVVALVALAIVVLIGYGIGTQHGKPHPEVLSGRAYVGMDVGSVKVDGWVYGFEITPGMQWYDARGEQHEGGVPPCLRGAPGHFASIRFGYSMAFGPHGDRWRQVDWVQCLGGRP